jgi:hypothetical protein
MLEGCLGKVRHWLENGVYKGVLLFPALHG